MVFHRILDLETGQDFHPALFFYIYPSVIFCSLMLLNKKITFLTSKFKKPLYIRLFIG